MLDYNREHWEQVMQTVLERVGPTAFLDHVIYALEQSDHLLAHRLARRLQDLTMFEVLTPEPADDD